MIYLNNQKIICAANVYVVVLSYPLKIYHNWKIQNAQALDHFTYAKKLSVQYNFDTSERIWWKKWVFLTNLLLFLFRPLKMGMSFVYKVVLVFFPCEIRQYK